MITREQVADLREGDVVEYAGHPALHGAKLVGPLRIGETGALCIGDGFVVRSANERNTWVEEQEELTLTVVSRAPRPLYVNHDRTEPVPGDVARDADCDARVRVWSWTEQGWQAIWMHQLYGPSKPECRLRLLVDGTTGEVVP